MVQVALFVGALVTALLGVFVLLNNPKSTLFRLYFVFSISSACWIAANALSVSGPILLIDGNLLFLSQLITPFSLVASLTFGYFLKFFRNTKLRPADIIFAIPTAAVGLFSFTTFNVHLDHTGRPLLGALYPFYLAAIMFNVLLIFLVLYGSNGKKEKQPYQHLQLNYLRVGALAALLPAVGFGAILPMFSDSTLVNISPLFSLIFLMVAGVAIIRHQLFDVRLVVVRSLAYLTALATFAVVYGVLVFGIASIVFDLHFALRTQVFFSVATSAAALTFQYFRHVFDLATKKVFYQDAYEPQVFFDQLNKVLVSTIDLKELLTKTTQVIEQNLKASFCVVAIKEPGNGRARIIGGGNVSFSQEDLARMHSGQGEFSLRKKILITDYLDSSHEELRRILAKNNIAMIARLGKGPENEPGHIILGTKKSGNAYTSQDESVIETITNELIIAVQNALHYEEIQQFNETLQQKVDDATHRLSETNKKLKAMDETKDDFIGMASHQLRTPLTSVKGYLSLVLDGDAGKITSQQRQLLTQAFISSQRMVFLIADLLNVSRLKTGKFVIEPTSVNLADMITDEISQLKETAAARELTLEFHKPAHFPTLNLDETKTRQVVMNFLDNAVYYTPSGGHIVATLTETARSIELRVTDNGIGVPKAEQHHLFSKFYRAKNAQKARPDGTGLGLFMAKKVIIAQGGAIIFDSKEGEGSTFGFVFPKRPAPRPAQIQDAI
jgi:signal transduction histidine kinase